MSRYTAEQLEKDPSFRQINMLSYDDIISFVWKNIRIKNSSTSFYFFINTLYLVFVAGISLTGFLFHGFTIKPYFGALFWGILAGSFAVIPFHEGFHGLAYKLAGAPSVRFGADMKQMLFYVAADRYVVGRRSFYFVALAPFVAINVISIVAGLFLSGYWHIFLGVFLLFHNIMCVGDFAMISFFQKNRDRELYTFDDHKNKVSYIYERISPGWQERPGNQGNI